MTGLEPIEPETALEMYLNQRRQEVSDATLKAHRYRLQHFVRWAQGDQQDDPELENMNNVTGRRLYQYRQWRREDGGLNNVSMRTQLSTLRVFIRFCEQIDAVKPNTHQKIRIPDTEEGEGSRDSTVGYDRIVQILDHLETYQYASQKHVMLLMMWRTGCRVGGVHSLDLDDFDLDEQRLHFFHRPERGTSLKNGTGGERVAALTDQTTEIIADYIEGNRHGVEDVHGREPLLTTPRGRPNKTTLRDWTYELTQPCFYTGECPHDEDIPDCEYRRHDNRAGCPSNNPPHDVRRGSITYHLSDNVPKQAVSDRMDVKGDTLDEHYDKRSEEVKSEQRREYFT